MTQGENAPAAEGVRGSAPRKADAAVWAGRWGSVVAPRALLPGNDKTERRMVLVQWFIMPLVLAGCVIPLPRPQDPPTNAIAAAAIMAIHPLLYAVLGSIPWHSARHTRWRDALLTATDLTVATLVFYATAARPGYAQVLLYCAVALAATRYSLRRAFGITSLVALLLIFAALLPLHVAPPTLASEITGLYALTYLIGLLSHVEKAVGATAADNARLAQTVMQRNRELSTLHSLARALNTETDVLTLLQMGLEGMAEALELRGARAYLRLGGDELRLAAQISAGAVPVTMDLDRRRDAERAVAEQRTIVTRLGYAAEPASLKTPGTLGAAIPLLVDGAVAAVIQVDLAAQTANPNALETLEVFCGELAVAMENAILRGEAHRTAILREKNRIAEELHDTVLQMLFSVGLRLQWTLDRLPEGSELRGALAEARRLSARAGGELRGAIFTLRSDTAEIGLVQAVEQLVQKQAAQAGWTANVMTSGDPPALPVLVQNAAHRVVREALMNAYKYARATEVVVSLRFAPSALTVVVQDNGVGIAAEALCGYRHMPDHFGLRSVAEQVEELAGEFMVYNNDEQGTAVKAVIPLAGQVIQAA